LARLGWRRFGAAVPLPNGYPGRDSGPSPLSAKVAGILDHHPSTWSAVYAL